MLKISILTLNFPKMGDFQLHILEDNFPTRRTFSDRLKFGEGGIAPAFAAPLLALVTTALTSGV